MTGQDHGDPVAQADEGFREGGGHVGEAPGLQEGSHLRGDVGNVKGVSHVGSLREG